MVPSIPNSLIGSVHIQIDGRQAVPFGVQIYARDVPEPVVDVAFTSIAYGAPEERNFTFTPPAGAKMRAQTSELGLSRTSVRSGRVG